MPSLFGLREKSVQGIVPVRLSMFHTCRASAQGHIQRLGELFFQNRWRDRNTACEEPLAIGFGRLQSSLLA
jgi:hypothetical protein